MNGKETKKRNQNVMNADGGMPLRIGRALAETEEGGQQIGAVHCV